MKTRIKYLIGGLALALCLGALWTQGNAFWFHRIHEVVIEVDPGVDQYTEIITETNTCRTHALKCRVRFAPDNVTGNEFFTVNGLQIHWRMLDPQEWAIYPEMFDGCIPNDSMVDCAPAFNTMHSIVQDAHNTRKPIPPLRLKSNAIYHIYDSIKIAKSDWGAENARGASAINWMGPAGGVMVYIDPAPDASGSATQSAKIGQVEFNRSCPTCDYNPNGRAGWGFKVEDPEGFWPDYNIDHGWVLDHVKIREVDIGIDLGSKNPINWDQNDDFRCDKVIECVRVELGPGSCMFRFSFDHFTVHRFQYFLHVINNGASCQTGISLEDARIEFLNLDTIELPVGSPAALIKFTQAAGGGDTGVWFHLSDIYGQADTANYDWSIFRFEDLEGINGLQPNIHLEMVGLNGPLVAGDVHANWLADPLLTAPDQLRFSHWIVGRSPSWAPWVPVHEAIFP